MGQHREAESKFQELINPALLLHRFLVAYYTFTKPVMIIITIIMIIRSYTYIFVRNSLLKTGQFRICSDYASVRHP
jgi:hypothetical protein